MRLLKKLVSNKNFFFLIFVVFFGLLAGRSLMGAGYFNMHDDLQMMRQLEMEKCFLDNQIPCRWVPDMGYGFGFPLFNFYPPLPYLIGQGIRFFGFSFVDTAKALFVLSLVVSGVTMYLLAKEFFKPLGAIISSVFYIWAPYHATDVFVRGAMNEAWSLAWFPLIFWAGYRLIKGNQRLFSWTVALTLSWFALFTSHNLMVLIFTPVFGLWCLLWLVKEKAWHKIPRLLVAGFWALGLAAFFTLPAVLENKFTHIKSTLVGYYDYTAHFVNLDQLFISRFWGYGPSVWGVEEDRMAFQVGHFHWVISLVIAVWIGWRFYKKRKFDQKMLLLSLFLLIGWLSAFLCHSRSTPIWKLVSFLSYLQFPWRFLALVTFAFSFLAGGLVFIIPKSRFMTVSFLIVVAVIAFNWNYFLPENGQLGALTDKEKFSDAAWELQQTAGIYDYLPIEAKMAPQEPRKVLAEILEGQGEVLEESEGTNWARFGLAVESEKAVVRISILDFPEWKVFVDGQETKIRVPEEEKWGRIWIDVDQGEHEIEAKLFDTQIRKVGNLLSLGAWLVLASSPLWRKKFV
jgi:hypothetical protein